MNEEYVVYVKSYKRVWKLKRFFYHIDRFKLPRPVTFLQALYFIVSLFIVILLNAIAPFVLGWVPSTLVHYIIIPALMALYLSKVKYDGKAPHKWLYTQVRYLLSHKYINRYKEAEKPGKITYSGITTVRELYTVIDQDNTNRKKKKRKIS